MIKRLFKYIFDKDFRFNVNSYKLGMHKKMGDADYLKRMYRAVFHKDLNLDNPQTFNEKLQWLKLYDRKAIYSTMVDKYEAKRFVGAIIGEKHVIPTLGVWDRFDEIDFGKLPNQFVLKCTHDSGGLVICRDKNHFNYSQARKKLNKCLKNKFFYGGREWPYKNVKPRIIAEQYMENEEVEDLRSYGVFCYEEVSRTLFGSANQRVEVDLLNVEFKQIPMVDDYKKPNTSIANPETFDKMLSFSKRLTQRTQHFRCDFYEVNGKAYFGEFVVSNIDELTPSMNKKPDQAAGVWKQLPAVFGGGYVFLGDKYVIWCHCKKINSLIDYKFYCFNGEPRFLYISSGLEDHSTASISFVTLDWQFAPYERADFQPFIKLPPKPKAFDKMIEFSKRLSKGTPFLRVDLYQIKGEVFFSELTFSPCAGFMPFKNPKHDLELGKLIELPKRIVVNE